MRNKYSMRKIILLLAIALVVPPAIGNATNHKPTLAQIEAAKKAEAAKKKVAADALKRLEKARGNLRALTAISKAAEAKYLAARNELARATVKSVAATKIYEEAVASVAFTHREIGKLAVHAYRTGGGLTDIEMLLDARGPQELVDRISTLDNLGATNKTALSRFKSAEDKAQKAKAVADAAREEQRVVTIRVADAKKEADDARAEQQKEVEKLQAVQDKLQRDLASAKKVRITLEQRRQLAILEETRANEATKVTGQSKIWRTGGPTGAKSSRTTQAQRLQAVEFAKRQVLAKKPYVWGDEGPNTFDCSGLVYAAYKSAGLGWPIAEMEPGDLLFYSYKGTISTIHHISIYAGNGMMWEARSTKKGLRYSDIYSMPGMMPFAGRV
jgi:cell wall-associated NlpC family hydrolase